MPPLLTIVSNATPPLRAESVSPLLSSIPVLVTDAPETM
jgi:hypothetical protein